jgi:hypothetical protein
MVSWYMGSYNTRNNTPTDVTLDLGGAQVSGQTYQISVTVCIEAGGAGKTMRIYVVDVLDGRYDSGLPTYSRNSFQQAATPLDVTLSPGECETITRQLTFSSVSWSHQDDIKIIAWAQAPNSSAPANVYQAAVMSWPFIIDCNGNGVPDDQDISSGYSQDCNVNGVPDECDIDFCSGDPACADCDGNGVPDGCDDWDLTDCDGNGISDACELFYGTADDCNNNGVVDACDVPPICDDPGNCSDDCDGNLVPDECELAGNDCNNNGVLDSCDLDSGTSTDCDGNGIPDECDLDDCDGSPWCDDCNENGRIDACDFVVPLEAASPQLAPLGGGPSEYTFVAPPAPLTDVTLRFTAQGDLNSALELVNVELNGSSIGTIYNFPASTCAPDLPDTIELTMAEWNSLVAGGDATVTMTPNAYVDPNDCGGDTWITVALEFDTAGSEDLNSNGIPDECEGAWDLGDLNCDGFVSAADIDPFVIALTSGEAGYLAQFPNCVFLNADCNNDGTVSAADIDPFVMLLTGK